MRYNHERQRSAELLRLALPLMTQQDAGLHPISYALWYEYAAGENPPLSEQVDRLTKNGERLSEETTAALFERHIAGIDPEAAGRIGEAIQRVMADISNSATQASDDAARFGATIDTWASTLPASAGGSVAESALKTVLQGTHQIRGAMGSLKSRLEESRSEIDVLRSEIARVRQEAHADGLTGLANRRAFDLALAECLVPAPNDAGRSGTCLIMADIDHFKRVNDTYGHLFGDKVLRAVAQVLTANTKGRDLVARYGGEEFAIIVRETAVDDATRLAETIRTAIERGRIKRMERSQTETIEAVTISLGVAACRPGEDASDVIRRADAALYGSKATGRNRVTVASDC